MVQGFFVGQALEHFGFPEPTGGDIVKEKMFKAVATLGILKSRSFELEAYGTYLHVCLYECMHACM